MRSNLAKAALLTAMFAPLGHAQEAAPDAIRVMTFNIRYATAADGPDHWSRRRELVADTIRRNAPQIVGVQEALAFQLDFLARCMPTYRRLGVGRDADGGGEYSALFIDDARFEVVADGTFWLSATPDEPGSIGWDAALPRICTWAELRDRSSHARLRVWNTHFDHRGKEARRHSAEMLGTRVTESALPDIVMGDLNTAESDAPLASLRAAGLRDTFRVLHPDEERAGTFNGFGRTAPSAAKIDYVLVDGDFDVLATSIDRTTYSGRHASDHDAVTAELVLRERRR